MEIIGNIYRCIKGTVGLLSLGCGVTVILAVTSPGGYVIGGLMMLSSTFIFFDLYNVDKVIGQLEQINKDYAHNNGILANSLNEMIINEEKLSYDLGDLELKIESIDLTRVALEKEVVNLGEQNKTLEDHLVKLKLIQDNANKLIRSLMDVGDNFQDFGKILKDNIDRLDNTAEMMETLVSKMGQVRFEEIDSNHDKSISQEEMQTWLALHKTRQEQK